MIIIGCKSCNYSDDAACPGISKNPAAFQIDGSVCWMLHVPDSPFKRILAERPVESRKIDQAEVRANAKWFQDEAGKDKYGEQGVLL